jgi:hypothetical protein
MIGLLVRLVGLLFLAAALVAIVIDGARSIAVSSVTMTPLGTTWFSISPSSLGAAQAAVQRNVEPVIGAWVWNPVIQWILLRPTWLVLGAVAMVLLLFGRRPRRRRAAAPRFERG